MTLPLQGRGPEFKSQRAHSPLEFPIGNIVRDVSNQRFAPFSLMVPLRVIQLFDLAHFSAGPLTNPFLFSKKKVVYPKEKIN